MDRLDVVIFGATGFTGKYTVEELVRLLPEYKDLTWGVAGRSKEKLSTVIKEVESATGVDLSHIPLIIADIKDKESLLDMAKRAKVIVNCCGPYRFFGEPVVKACIEAKTHQVDVTGEPQYMETVALKYDQAAKDAGVYIINACGFDCIPNDLGVVFLESQFDGTVNSVESHMVLKSPRKTESAAALHYGTWESAIYGVAHWSELKELRRKMFKAKLPELSPKLQPRSVIHKIDDGKWYVPFLGADSSVIYRTQRFFYTMKEKRPIQARIYIGFPLIVTLALMLYGLFFAIAVRFKWMRKLMLQHPKMFTFGYASHEGPKESTMRNTHFVIKMRGRGWDKSVTDFDTVPPNKTINVKVTGTNPGYGATCVALVLSALTILKQQHKIPGNGGVLTTGAAFAETDLIENLHNHNLRFEVMPTKSNL